MEFDFSLFFVFFCLFLATCLIILKESELSIYNHFRLKIGQNNTQIFKLCPVLYLIMYFK